MQDQSDVHALIEEFESQSRCDPTDFMARYNLGVAYDSLCLSENAVAAYRSAILIEPNYAAAHFNLGCDLLQAGLLQEARAEFEEVIRLAPHMAEGFFMLGSTYGAMGFPEKLIEITKAGLKLQPKSADACFNVGSAYNRLDRYADALSFLRESTSLNPKNANAWFELGKTYRGLGNLSEEIRAYRKALAIRGDFVDVWLYLGASYVKVWHGTDAPVKYVDANGSLRLDDAEHLFYFALGLLALGMTEQAKQKVEPLHSVAPQLARELQAYLDGAEQLRARIVAALKRTWDQINPNSRNPYIAPSTSTMCCITMYGEDGEATRAYMAMPEPEQQQLLCEVFPEWYPSDPDGQGVQRIPRIPEYPSDPDGQGS